MSDEQEYDPRRYWEETLRAGFDESGAAHPNLPQSFNRALYRALRVSTTTFLERHALRPASVLDVGFGTGLWLDFWRGRGVARLAGVDLTEIAVERGRARYPDLELGRVDIANQPIPFTGFELVSAMNVLLHVVEEDAFDRALTHLRGTVCDDGVLLAAEPVAVHAVHIRTGGSAAVRTVERWRAALAGAGFELVALAPATCLLANPVDARSARRLAVLTRLWFAVTQAVGSSETRGAIVAALLSPADRVCTRLARVGPSGKLLLARAVSVARQ